MSHFWKPVPRLAPKDIRGISRQQNDIVVLLKPPEPGEVDPFKGGPKGQRHFTKLQSRLRSIQAVQIADLEAMITARANVIALKNDDTRGQDAVSLSLNEELAPVVIGPTSVQTLLRDGRALARRRDEATDVEYQGYLPAVKARRLEMAHDLVGLDHMIVIQLGNIALAGHALNAAQAFARGMRAVLVQVGKGRRPLDETISRRIVDDAEAMTIAEMVEFATVSGIIPSHLWLQYYGEPGKIDYHRLFELAVFVGQLERGENAELHWEVARFILEEYGSPSAMNLLKVALYPNHVDVGFALATIRAKIDAAYNIFAFLPEAIACSCPGEMRMFRVRPMPA